MEQFFAALAGVDDNPYREGHCDYWRIKRREATFWGQTIGNFKIQYTWNLGIVRMNNDEFNAAQMLETENQNLLLERFNNRFVTWMKETNRFFHIYYLNAFGDVIQVTDGKVVDDIGCVKTINEFEKQNFTDSGCGFDLSTLKVRINRYDEELLEENCRMIDQESMERLKDEIRGRQMNEALTMLYLKEWLEFRTAWKKKMESGNNRKYTGRWIEVETESQGNEAILRWNYKNDSQSASFHLRGFRKEGGYALADDDASQGTLIVDRWGPDWKAERLEIGKTYFYTFKVSIRHHTGDEVFQERLRFEVTIQPSASDAQLVKTITEFIERVENNRKSVEKVPPENEYRKKVREFVTNSIEKARGIYEARVEIEKAKEALLADVRNGKYTKEQKEELGEELNSICEGIFEECKEKFST